MRSRALWAMWRTTSGYFDLRAIGRVRPTLLRRSGATLAQPTFQETTSRITSAPSLTRRRSLECQYQSSPLGTSLRCQNHTLPIPPLSLPASLNEVEILLQEQLRAAALRGDQIVEQLFRELVADIATPTGTDLNSAMTPTNTVRRTSVESPETTDTTVPFIDAVLARSTTLTPTETPSSHLSEQLTRQLEALEPPAYEPGPPPTYEVVGALLDHPILAHTHPRLRREVLGMALLYDQAPGLIGGPNPEDAARTQRARDLLYPLTQALQTATLSIGHTWSE